MPVRRDRNGRFAGGGKRRKSYAQRLPGSLRLRKREIGRRNTERQQHRSFRATMKKRLRPGRSR